MKKMRMLTEQTLMISFFMLCIIALGQTIEAICGDYSPLPWYMPLSILLVSILCSIPTLLIIWDRECSRLVRIGTNILHFFLEGVVVLGGGYFFSWYSDFDGMCSVTVSYVIVYILIWVGMRWIQKYEEKMMNAALEKFCDEE